ncbi:MAG TPA: Nif3-like dinuclear metal center hexameric protein [Bryobacteraceae bacterium]|nr:Nif3-like dinuclear metal center hexameric protein [Bryobacteraceae bacterium]
MTSRIILLSFAASACLFGQAATHPTARQIVALIEQNTKIPWQGETVDTFKAGDPDTPVTGIATAMMATFEVIKAAAAENANFIITHEPTFYSHLDATRSFEAANDPVWREKEKFIAEHHLVIWRFHDHWHMMKPDGILRGMADALQWEGNESVTDPNLFVLPPTKVRDLARTIQQRIGIGTLRVVGNPDLEVTNIALQPGAAGTERHLAMLRRDDVQALVIGEVPEWETIEYVSDAAAQGRPKALILMGHIESEQAGMAYCAAWLKTFIHDVPIQFVITPEPYWQPE